MLQVSNAIEAFQQSLRPELESVLADVQTASGKAAAKDLKSQLRASGMRQAASIEFAFDESNPRAQAWVKAHAGDLIDDISESIREDIRDLVEQAFDGDFDVKDLASQIEDLIGDEARAETIARTETMRASNEGQLEAWDQAVDAGLLTGVETKEWITTPDDITCPICEPMDGLQAPLNGLFDLPGGEGQIDQPPAHPRCRCTIALTV